VKRRPLRHTRPESKPVTANEATDGAADPREFWTVEQVIRFNDGESFESVDADTPTVAHVRKLAASEPTFLPTDFSMRETIGADGLAANLLSDTEFDAIIERAQREADEWAAAYKENLHVAASMTMPLPVELPISGLDNIAHLKTLQTALVAEMRVVNQTRVCFDRRNGFSDGTASCAAGSASA
jgi:hypothetical protein